jgi:hypothetical protein
MGGGDKTTIKQQIQSEINVKISQATENITKVVNESMTKVSTEMVNTAVAKIEQATSASNVAKIKGIRAVGGSKVNVEQTAKAKATNDAIISIIQDSSALSDLASKTANDVANKVQQDAALKASLESAAKMSEKSKEAGGPEAMVNKLADTAKDMFDSLTASKNETNIDIKIRQQLSMEFENKVVNMSDIVQKTTSEINTTIRNETQSSCKFDTGAGNLLDLEDVGAIQGSEINIKQMADVEAFNKCLINMNIGGKVINSIVDEKLMKNYNDTSQAAKADVASKASAEKTSEKEQESAIMKSVDNLVDEAGNVVQSGIKAASMGLYLIIGAVALGGLLIIFLIYKLMSSGSLSVGDLRGRDYDTTTDVDEEQEGGGLNNLLGGGILLPGNLYLWLAVLALLFYTYGKSVPMCGVLLITVGLYVLLKTKTIEIAGLDL